MIILHTSDWHLGAQLHGYDRTDAQFTAIRNIINVAAQRKVDAVVVSGDAMTSAQARLRDRIGCYVRASVIDAAGRRAWTNPIFFCPGRGYAGVRWGG